MKKCLAVILALILMLSLCSCSVNNSVVTSKQAVDLDVSGIVKADTIKKLKKDNAIQIFKGQSGDIRFEWTLFGSNFNEVRDINLSADISVSEDSVTVKFSNDESFEFKPLLSVYLNSKWTSLAADIFVNNEKIGTAELTGTDITVINFTVGDVLGEYVIKPANDSSEIPTAENTQNSENPNLTAEAASQAGSDSVQNPAAQVNNSSAHQTDSKSGETQSNTSSTKRNVSNGQQVSQDKYNTDPVPAGKPLPVEPEDKTVDKKVQHSCYFSIECSTIFNNLDELDEDKLGELPSNGIILKKQKVTFYEGESVFDVLQRVCKQNGIQMESRFTPMYNSAYVSGINNLYEFDCGSLSGWMYRVNGWYPNYGCSRYQLQDGEVVEWRYTCDLGKDVGCDWMG